MFFFAANGQETTWSSGQRLRTSVSATKPLHAHSQARKMKIIEDALALAGRKDRPQRRPTSNHRQNKVVVMFLFFIETINLEKSVDTAAKGRDNSNSPFPCQLRRQRDIRRKVVIIIIFTRIFTSAQSGLQAARVHTPASPEAFVELPD